MKKFYSTLFLASAVLAQTAIAQTVVHRTIHSSPSNSAWAYIDANDPGCNTASMGMVIADWTVGGSPVNWRSLIQFDLSFIPDSSTIDTATLSLYADITSPSGITGSPTYGPANATGIYRILEPWTTSSLSWTLQPGYSGTLGDTLAQSVTTNEDYLDINVLPLIKPMSGIGAYGFMIKHLQETNPYNSMIFYSPDYYYTDSMKTPTLNLVYTVHNLGAQNLETGGQALSVSPNPVTDVARISFSQPITGDERMILTDAMGRVVRNVATERYRGLKNIPIDMRDLVPGVYSLSFTGFGGVTTLRVVKF